MTTRQALTVMAVVVCVPLVPSNLAAQADTLTRLGTTSTEAHESIFGSFMSGIPWMNGEASVFKAATPEQRALLTRGLIAVARAFTESSEFAARYARFREGQRPQMRLVAKSGDEALAEQEQAMAEAIREAEASAAQLPPEVRKQFEQNIADMKRQMAEFKTDPARRAALDEAARADAKSAEAEHQELLAEFERRYPADARALVASRLQQFLEVCGDVDYTAPLQQGKDKKFRFVDPALERKPTEWKLCYRAGKVAVDAARAAATEWLAALR